MATKLVIVEGLPGTGKTSTARYVADLLAGSGQDVSLFQEGASTTPPISRASPCSRRKAGHATLLRERAAACGHGLLVPYLLLHEDAGLPPALLAGLERHDVYSEMHPQETYSSLLLWRWRAFAAAQAHQDATAVFECSLLQNPLCALFVQRDANLASVRSLVEQLVHEVAALQPKLIYLHQPDIAATIDRVLPERSSRWRDFVVAYHTQQGYGKALGLHGLAGYVEVLRARKAMELAIVEGLPVETLLLDTSGEDWEEGRRRILSFLLSTP